MLQKMYETVNYPNIKIFLFNEAQKSSPTTDYWLPLEK